MIIFAESLPRVVLAPFAGVTLCPENAPKRLYCSCLRLASIDYVRVQPHDSSIPINLERATMKNHP